MNVEVTHEWYSPKKCLEKSDSLFIFGDNVERWGKGGQAIIRDEINAAGIATKKSPSEYFSDEDYWQNIRIINTDIFLIKEKVLNDMYESVIFPAQGLGSGLSNMQEKCPRTFLYLCERLLDEFGFNNLANLKSK